MHANAILLKRLTQTSFDRVLKRNDIFGAILRQDKGKSIKLSFSYIVTLKYLSNHVFAIFQFEPFHVAALTVLLCYEQRMNEP